MRTGRTWTGGPTLSRKVWRRTRRPVPDRGTVARAAGPGPREQPWGPAWRAAGVSGLASGKEGEEAERQRRRFQTTLAVADLIHLEVWWTPSWPMMYKGDFMEAGVFRGGACIMLRGSWLLNGMCIAECTWRTRSRASRRLEGTSRTCRRARSWIPSSTRRLIGWIGSWPGEDLVRYNFRRYGLLDDRVRFLRGFFNESLPPVFGSTSTERPVTVDNAPTLALLRIDAGARRCIGRSRGRLPPPVAGRLRDY